MDGLLIDRAMRQHPLLKKIYGATVSSDHQRLCLQKPGVYVINTDPSYLPGEHWVCLLHHPHSLYYFDPYGLPPHPNILRSLSKCSKPLYYHRRRLQGSGPTCGYFCIYFALTLVDRRFNLDVFTCNHDKNDYFVVHVVKSVFPRLFQ